MKVETKFSIGDKVWYMDKGQPKSDTIFLVFASFLYSEKTISYGLGSPYKNTQVFEENLFATKEELLKSIKS